jgi:TolB-like protein/Tfp pilus assembly protein PilF
LSLFQQLRQRKVIRVAAVYLVTAWLVLQIVDVLGDALNLPGWTAPLVVVLLGVGFVVAVILAWAFEMTPDGVRRASALDATAVPPGQSPIDYVIVGLLVVAIASVIYTGQDEDDSRREAVEPVTEVAEVPVSQQAEPERAVLRNSIAVLPFENLSPDPDNAYFAAGIHEETLNQLAKIKDLSVIARTTMMRYADGQKSIPEIGTELNVGAVMEGSVRYAGHRVRITAQLIDVQTGAHLWSEAYDRDLEDIFAIQSDIALNITDAMKAEFRLVEQQAIAAIPTSNLQAYSSYVKGLALINQLPPALEDGIAAFERAIDLDPRFAVAMAHKALAHSGMVRIQTVSGLNRELEQLHLRTAQSLAESSLAIDPNQAVAHLALAMVADTTRRWEAALRHGKTAYELSPNSAVVNYAYGELKANIQGAADSVELLDRAAALDPLNALMPFFSVVNMLVNERLEDARRYAQMTIARAPDAYAPYVQAGFAAVVAGDRAAAETLLMEAEARVPERIEPGERTIFMALYRLLDRPDAMEREYLKLIAQGDADDWALMRAEMRRGNLEKSLDHLHAMIDNDYPAISVRAFALHWNNPRLFGALHGHPRFIAAVERLGEAAQIRARLSLQQAEPGS